MQDYIPQKIDINGKIKEITVKQFDNNSRLLEFSISDAELKSDDGNAFDMTNCSAALYIQPEGSRDSDSVAYVAGTVESAESGIVTFLLPGSVTQTVGRYKCEIWINEGDTANHPVISTKPFILTVEESIRNDEAIMASGQYSALDKWATDLIAVISRMDNIEAMADDGEIPAGTVESEVAAARVGWDGTSYNNLGEAVRKQAQDCNARIDDETLRQYPTRIRYAWFDDGDNPRKTVLDLPYNRIYDIGNDFTSTYAEVGLPCNGYGTLIKFRPYSNANTLTGFTVYLFTAFTSVYSTVQYYAYTSNTQDIGKLVWYRYNCSPANRGINSLGLESKSIVFIGDSIVDGVGSSDYDGYNTYVGGHSERSSGSDGFAYTRYTNAAQTTEASETQYFNTGSYCWANKMIDYLTSTYNDVTAVNRGIDSLSAKELNKNLADLVTYGDNQHFDVAVIAIGINDHSTVAANPDERILTPLTRTIERLMEMGIQPIVFSNAPLWRPQGESKPKGKNAETVHSAIVTACNMAGVPCYDMFTEFREYMHRNGLIWSDVMNNDGLHPNDSGYEIMFRIAKKLMGV